MTTAGFWVLVLGACLVGFAKTAINGTVTVAVAMFAMVLPARESTGVLLLLLMVGDVLAVWTYRRDAAWSIIRRLLVPVVVGVVAGSVFLAASPAGWLKPVIGAIVVVMSLIQVVRQARGRFEPGRSRSTSSAATGAVVGPGRDTAEVTEPVGTRSSFGFSGSAGVFGSLAGFTTMVANAGGPVMTLYLLRSNLEVTRFVGTLAWFFACVNLVKLPFSVGLGLVRPERLELVAVLVPAVIVGAIIGRVVIRRIPRSVFENVVLAVALLSGLWLMVS